MTKHLRTYYLRRYYNSEQKRSAVKFRSAYKALKGKGIRLVILKSNNTTILDLIGKTLISCKHADKTGGQIVLKC